VVIHDPDVIENFISIEDSQLRRGVAISAKPLSGQKVLADEVEG
jgi:hypothetical protein